MRCFYFSCAPGGGRGGHPEKARAQAAAAALEVAGADLVAALVDCLTSRRPAYGLDGSKSNPSAVLWQVGLGTPSPNLGSAAAFKVFSSSDFFLFSNK